MSCSIDHSISALAPQLSLSPTHRSTHRSAKNKGLTQDGRQSPVISGQAEHTQNMRWRDWGGKTALTAAIALFWAFDVLWKSMHLVILSRCSCVRCEKECCDFCVKSAHLGVLWAIVMALLSSSISAMPLLMDVRVRQMSTICPNAWTRKSIMYFMDLLLPYWSSWDLLWLFIDASICGAS